jgi:hypothetical protein
MKIVRTDFGGWGYMREGYCVVRVSRKIRAVSP